MMLPVTCDLLLVRDIRQTPDTRLSSLQLHELLLQIQAAGPTTTTLTDPVQDVQARMYTVTVIALERNKTTRSHNSLENESILSQTVCSSLSSSEILLSRDSLAKTADSAKGSHDPTEVDIKLSSA